VAKLPAIHADTSAVPRKHTKGPEKPESLKPSSPAPVGIVVRRGAQRRFQALTRKTSELPVVVSWDRRRRDRRRSSQRVQDTDQRTTERRQEVPFTWEIADFVVVDRAPDASDSTRSTTKATKRQATRKGRA
jgi:hypothetical protein